MKKLIILTFAICFTVFATKAQQINRIITDFGGYWSSSTTNKNPVEPNNDHHVLAFEYNNVIYSTGVNNTILNTYSVTYKPGNFKALPAILTGTVPGNATTAITVLTGSMKDGNATAALLTHPNIKDLTLQSVLTDGTQGLNIGTGYTNLPSSTTARFQIYNVLSDKISDTLPDLLITQIADPAGANDVFYFSDANFNIVGDSFKQNLNNIALLGTQRLDLYTAQKNVPYSQAKPIAIFSANTTRDIRMMAIKLSDLGIRDTNYTRIKYFSIKPSGNSDVAFVGYNADAINVGPATIVDFTATDTTICAAGGIVKLKVDALPASNGALSYVWEVSSNSGATWSTVSNNATYSGSATNTLLINATSSMSGYKYRVIVTEATTTLSTTSDVFTIAIAASVSTLSGKLNPDSITTCLDAAPSPNYISVAPTGGTGSYSYQWSSSTTANGTYTDIPGAVYSHYYPDLSVANTMFYKVNIRSGCYSNLSAPSRVVVNGQNITSVVPGTICSNAPNNFTTLNAVASGTGGTYNWYASASSSTALQTGSSSSFQTPQLTTSTTYYVSVTSNGCTSARYPDNAIVTNTITLNSTNFQIAFATSPCAGGASTVYINSSALPAANYTVQYSISGSNTITNQTAPMTFLNGNGSFSTVPLSNAGANTITVVLVTVNGCILTPASGNTFPINVQNGVPSITGLTTNATHSCTNANSEVTIGNNNLASGTYIVKYDVTGSNTITNGSAQVLYTSGTPGHGSFILPFMSNAGSNTVTITSIALLASPDCAATPAGPSASAGFINNIQPVVDAGFPIVVCPDSTLPINIGTGAKATNYAALSWNTPDGTGVFGNNNTTGALTNTTYTFTHADIIDSTRLLTLTATGNTGCANVSKSIPLTIHNTYIWRGNTNDDFGTASNWVVGCVPFQGASIKFELNPGNICKLDMDRILDTIGNQGTTANNILDLNAHKLTVLGKLTFDTLAKIDAQAPASIMEFKGYASQTIPNLVFKNKTVSNLAFDNASNVSMTDSVFITHTLRPTLGTLNTNGVLTLRSTAALTARVTRIANTSTTSINGHVIVERFIPSTTNRAWRLLASPLSPVGAPTIFNSWQEGTRAANGAYQPGYGTFVSRPGAGISNGYDSSSISTSLQYWNGSSLITPATTDNSTTDLITNHGGAWFLFVRGDKNLRPEMYPASSVTTLRQKGTLNQGIVTVGQTGTNFSMIPNPYASPINFDTIARANAIPATFYVWDASLNVIGGYRAITKDLQTGLYTATPAPATGNDNTFRYLQSGQAFLIPGNTQLTFAEDMKADSIADYNVYKTTSDREELQITLRKAGGQDATVDGARVWFDSSYNAAVTAEDILKPQNISENFAVGVDTNNLFISKQPQPGVSDTIQLKFWNATLSNYELEVQANKLNSNLQPYLLDGYTNALTPVMPSAPATYSFAVTNSTGSWDINRFKIVFAAANPLSDVAVELTAEPTTKGARLNWKVNNQKDIASYEIEKSADGKKFTGLAQTNREGGEGKRTYISSDESFLKDEIAYYRIKAIGVNGHDAFSNTVMLSRRNEHQANLVVYPNPVTGQTFYISLSKVADGEYQMTLSNVHGQKVMTRTLYHTGVQASYPVSISGELAAGEYILTLSRNNEVVHSTKLNLSK